MQSALTKGISIIAARLKRRHISVIEHRDRRRFALCVSRNSLHFLTQKLYPVVKIMFPSLSFGSLSGFGSCSQLSCCGTEHLTNHMIPVLMRIIACMPVYHHPSILFYVAHDQILHRPLIDRDLDIANAITASRRKISVDRVLRVLLWSVGDGLRLRPSSRGQPHS